VWRHALFGAHYTKTTLGDPYFITPFPLLEGPLSRFSARIDGGVRISAQLPAFSVIARALSRHKISRVEAHRPRAARGISLSEREESHEREK